jgi:hypothetical protein
VVNVCEEREEIEMATQTIGLDYTLNEIEANKIAMTPRRKIKESGIFDDSKLSEIERIKRATHILKSRRK